MKRIWTIIGVSDVPHSFHLVPVAVWPAGNVSGTVSVRDPDGYYVTISAL
jgi:hypothetical protein